MNWNDVKRNLNLNWFDNDWNENYRFAAVRNSLCFPPYLGGFIITSEGEKEKFIFIFRPSEVIIYLWA
ncbi:MAG: hypothetical protein Q8M94_09880 [Ignavibacteria bacterium]|nr:hypothetical protein [Ignavibacteria bacterium]